MALLGLSCFAWIDAPVPMRAGWALPASLAKPEQYNLTLRLEARHFRPSAAAQTVNATAVYTLAAMRATSCLVPPCCLLSPIM